MKIVPVVLLLLVSAGFTARLAAQHGGSSAGAMMHGDTQSKEPAVLAPVTFAPGVKEDKPVATFMAGFAQALFSRDAKPMVPQLAEKYLIEGYPAEKNQQEGFVMAMGMIPAPAKIHVTAIEPEGDGKIVKTELTYAARVAKRAFHFDAAGKLVNTDFISMKRPAPARPAEATPATPPQPEHK
jgi:hypothetical protein